MTTTFGKPFDLERAKAGDPVCTVGGYSVRILCFDRKSIAPPQGSIVTLVSWASGHESLIAYNEKGQSVNACDSQLELRMVPIKKKGWINIFSTGPTIPYPFSVGSLIYSSKEEATKKASRPPVDTVEIEWEE